MKNSAYIIVVSIASSLSVTWMVDPAIASDDLFPILSLDEANYQQATPATAPDPAAPGPLTGFGQMLRDHGIDTRVDWMNIYHNSPNFGFNAGQAGNYGLLLFNTTFNLSENFKIRYIQSLNVPNYNTDSYMFQLSSAFYPLPIIDSFSDLTRLSLQGQFLDNRLELEAGRIGLGFDFMKRGFCGGIGCINSTSAITLNLPGESLSVWGGRVGYYLTPETKLGLGVIEDNSSNWKYGSGWDWGTGTADGYVGVANVSHEETFFQSALPLTYEIGVYHGSASYEDALYNSGWGNPTYGPNTVVVDHDSGTTGIYGQARQVVWSRPNGTPVPENLAVYGGLFHTFGDGQAYPWEAYGGVEYSGFWKENPIAGFGATVHYIDLSEKRAEYERNARLFFSGVDEAQPQNTFQIDIYGRVGMGRYGVFTAGVAYMINPNTTVMADYSTGRVKDGFVIYSALAVDIGSILGLSQTRGL